ncbi:MAG: hypothetical protein AcusKO_29260 [Acuticoccus sp.]
MPGSFVARESDSGPFSALAPSQARSILEIGSVDNTADVNKPVSSATQAALDAKAPINSPTFTGTVGGVTKAMVGLANVDNTSDADKPVSTATQTALDAKAPTSNPTFTGTVSGVTKVMVGLGNVDNTSDADKPISTAAQTVFDDITEQFTFVGQTAGEIASQAFASPGLTTSAWTSSLLGRASSLPQLLIGSAATSDQYGTVWEIAGADFGAAYLDVARRADFLLIPGRIYRVRMILERSVDPVDPLSDGVEVRVQNLSKTHTNVSNVRIGAAHTVTVLGGALDVSFTVSREPPPGITVDYESPATTRYIRPYLRIFGGAPQVCRVALIEVEDVTLAEELRQRLAQTETVEIANLALSTSEAEFGETIAPSVTWDIVGTAPVGALSIRINGSPAIPLAVDAVSYSAPNATADTTYTVSITNAATAAVESASISLDFKHPNFWGASASAALDAAAVLALDNTELANSRPKAFNVEATAEYVFFAYPATYGLPTDYRLYGFSTDPVVTTVSVTTPGGATLNYRVLRTPETLTDPAVAVEVL